MEWVFISFIHFQYSHRIYYSSIVMRMVTRRQLRSLKFLTSFLYLFSLSYSYVLDDPVGLEPARPTSRHFFTKGCKDQMIKPQEFSLCNFFSKLSCFVFESSALIQFSWVTTCYLIPLYINAVVSWADQTHLWLRSQIPDCPGEGQPKNYFNWLFSEEKIYLVAK